jgi:hypothetical protein
MAEIPFGSTLVIVTALLPESLQDTLDALRRYRPNITLITLEETPPPDLPGIRIVHLPFVAEENGGQAVKLLLTWRSSYTRPRNVAFGFCGADGNGGNGHRCCGIRACLGSFRFLSVFFLSY